MRRWWEAPENRLRAGIAARTVIGTHGETSNGSHVSTSRDGQAPFTRARHALARLEQFARIFRASARGGKREKEEITIAVAFVCGVENSVLVQIRAMTLSGFSATTDKTRLFILSSVFTCNVWIFLTVTYEIILKTAGWILIRVYAVKKRSVHKRPLGEH